MTPLVGIPIKPFGVAKARLASVIDARGRTRLGKAVAAHTARCVAASGAEPVVVTSDPRVKAWARRLGVDVVDEPHPESLDAAAGAVVAAAGERPWAVLHADLPVLTPGDLTVAWAALAGGPVLCPSHDGGTSLVADRAEFSFSYGAGSFARHLAASPAATVVVRPGLALDLDTAADLAVARILPQGAWLADVIPLATRLP